MTRTMISPDRNRLADLAFLIASYFRAWGRLIRLRRPTRHTCLVCRRPYYGQRSITDATCSEACSEALERRRARA